MKPVTATLESTGSHYVNFGYQQFKEEVYLTFATEWRGEPTTVVVACDRYEHSTGISEWRIWEHRSNRDGAPLTPTAAKRVMDTLRPMAEAWLASEDYKSSERAAYVNTIRRELYDARPYADNPTRSARELVAVHKSKIGKPSADRLIALCNAYDAFAKLYNGLQ